MLDFRISLRCRRGEDAFDEIEPKDFKLYIDHDSCWRNFSDILFREKQSLLDSMEALCDEGGNLVLDYHIDFTPVFGKMQCEPVAFVQIKTEARETTKAEQIPYEASQVIKSWKFFTRS